MDTQSLWIQNAVQQKSLALKKVPGMENPSDLLTKHLDAMTIEKYLTKMGIVALPGPAGIAPELAQKAAKEVKSEEVIDGETSRPQCPVQAQAERAGRA